MSDTQIKDLDNDGIDELLDTDYGNDQKLN